MSETEVDLERGLDERLAQDDDESEADEAEAPHPPVDYSRIKKWVIQRDGKDYVQYVGLLDLLHQVSEGEFSITTKLEQAPTDANGQTAIVSAIACMGPNGSRMASGLGDANAGNVNRMMAPHTIRMAETRAKGRALRDLLNIGLVTIEELGPGGGSGSGGRRDSVSTEGQGSSQGADGIIIQNVRYTRAQIWDAYQMRMGQMREAKLPIPNGAALGQQAPLGQLAGATQNMKKKLAEAGKLPPPANGKSN
jgi:hypothetical protein